MFSGTRRPGLAALTIAGFDPSSGAGITADMAVFAAHGLFGISAITAITVQNTIGVRRVEPVSAALLTETLDCLETDLPPHGIKIGMLGAEPQVAAVAAYLQSLQRAIPVVLDPVLRSTSGAPLLSEEGIERLKTHLLPLVSVITPNAAELAILTGLSCRTDAEIHAAAESLLVNFPHLAVLCTGGDRPKPDDLLLQGDVWSVLAGEHIVTTATHGTGCAFSSAVLCGLVHGASALDAAVAAKQYVAQAMLRSTPRGAGRGPMNLLWPISQHIPG